LPSNYGASYEEISERLNHINGRISSLLLKELPIKPLLPEKGEIVLLASGLKHHFKVYSKKEPVPLKLKFIFGSITTRVVIYLSNTVKRPDKDNNDRMMEVNSKSMCLSYKSNRDKQKCFTNDFIYITIEADKDCTFMFKVGFGVTHLYKVDTSEVMEEAIKSGYLKSNAKNVDLDGSLSFLSSKFAIARSRAIKTGSIAKGSKRPLILIKKHRKKVMCQGQKNDDEDRLKKFISSNRVELKKKLMKIAKRELKHRNKMKALIIFWIYLIRIKDMGKLIFKRFVEYKKWKAENEMRIFKAIRIYSFLKVRLAVDTQGFKDRRIGKISAYSIL